LPPVASKAVPGAEATASLPEVKTVIAYKWHAIALKLFILSPAHKTHNQTILIQNN
jgi:hypothetical protein